MLTVPKVLRCQLPFGLEHCSKIHNSTAFHTTTLSVQYTADPLTKDRYAYTVDGTAIKWSYQVG